MRILALMYHDVSPIPDDPEHVADPVAEWYTVTPDAFAEHLDAIETAPLTPSLTKEPALSNSLFLTFDDGNESAITTAAPMLEQRGWRGHFFVATDRVGTPGFVSADEIRALVSRGHVVGSHSHTHPTMTELDDAEIRTEWQASRERLEEILDERVDTASVPTGFYARRVGRLAIEAGYRHLFTSEPWLRPRMQDTGTIYGRFSIRRGTTADDVRALCTFSPTTIARQRFGWQSRKVLKTALGPAYESVREFAIRRR